MVKSNAMFVQLAAFVSHKVEKDFIDYNFVVDDILQISPPYQSGMVYKPSSSEHNKGQIDPHGLKAAPIASSKNGNAILEAMNMISTEFIQPDPNQLALAPNWSISDIMNPEKAQNIQNLMQQLGQQEEYEFQPANPPIGKNESLLRGLSQFSSAQKSPLKKLLSSKPLASL